MEPDGDLPPIWSTPSTLFVPVRHRRNRRLDWVLNPVTLTIAFSVVLIIIVFLLLLLPPTLSRNNQVLKPNSSVKKSWNSINIFLVLFSVLCGVFSRRNDETSSSDGAETVPNAFEFVASGRRSVSGDDWLGSPDRKAYDEMSDYMKIGDDRLRRSSSSYPDLRQESLWGSDGEKFRYLDDFEVDFHRYVRQSHEVEKDDVAETAVREIPVDKFELNDSVSPSPTTTAPLLQVPQPQSPLPPPPPPVKRTRSIHSVPKQYNVERGGPEVEFSEKRSSLPPPSETPPPPELKFHPLAERREKIQRRKSGTTKEIAASIVSVLYQGPQRKRNKKVKSRDIFESVAQKSSPPIELAPSSIPSVPPPPPPPPPSKKVLQNLFKKSSKSKRVHSVSTSNSPPPPPPPPPNSIFNNIFKTGSISKRFQMTSASSQPPPPPPPLPPSSIFNSLFKNETKSRRIRYEDPHQPPPLPPTPRSRPKHSPASTYKPPKPTKPSTSHHENVVIAPVSPLIPMPPPPPPPPFTVPATKFIGKGDFIRIRSANSSRCSSPGREDFDVMSVKSDGGDSIGLPFTCPSPDVDLKADTFISKHRDEWRLEKINSLKEQRNMGSSSARLR